MLLFANTLYLDPTYVLFIY